MLPNLFLVLTVGMRFRGLDPHGSGLRSRGMEKTVLSRVWPGWALFSLCAYQHLLLLQVSALRSPPPGSPPGHSPSPHCDSTFFFSSKALTSVALTFVFGYLFPSLFSVESRIQRGQGNLFSCSLLGLALCLKNKHLLSALGARPCSKQSLCVISFNPHQSSPFYR